MELVGTGWHWHHVDMATRDLHRLAKYVRAHRLEQFSSRDAAATAAGVSKNTWKRVEEGEGVWEKTYAKIEKVLGWGTGSCLQIAEGGEPLLVGGTPSTATAPRLSEDALRKAAYEAAMTKLPDASIGAVREFADELVEVLRRAGELEDES